VIKVSIITTWSKQSAYTYIVYYNYVCVMLCQIADFGMARDVTGDSYYTSGGNVPVKWTAPEV